VRACTEPGISLTGHRPLGTYMCGLAFAEDGQHTHADICQRSPPSPSMQFTAYRWLQYQGKRNSVALTDEQMPYRADHPRGLTAGASPASAWTSRG